MNLVKFSKEFDEADSNHIFCNSVNLVVGPSFPFRNRINNGPIIRVRLDFGNLDGVTRSLGDVQHQLFPQRKGQSSDLLFNTLPIDSQVEKITKGLAVRVDVHTVETIKHKNDGKKFCNTVTTRITTFLVGDPYKPSFATVAGRGDNPIYTWCFMKYLLLFLTTLGMMIPVEHIEINFC